MAAKLNLAPVCRGRRASESRGSSMNAQTDTGPPPRKSEGGLMRTWPPLGITALTRLICGVHDHCNGKIPQRSEKLLLRPYQQDAVVAIIHGFGEFDRQSVVMPTAAGKTIIFLCQTHKHNLVRPAGQVAEDEEEAFGMNGDGDLIENSGRYRRWIFDKLSRELEANKKRQGPKVDLLEFAVAIGDLQIVQFQPSMCWHTEPVSQKQFDALERSGINPNSVRGKGHASVVIERLQDRRNRGLATYKQVRFLARHGVPNAHLVSFISAIALISKLISHKSQISPLVRKIEAL